MEIVQPGIRRDAVQIGVSNMLVGFHDLSSYQTWSINDKFVPSSHRKHWEKDCLPIRDSFLTTWRIIPVSKWLVTPIYKPFRPFGRGTRNHGY